MYEYDIPACLPAAAPRISKFKPGAVRQLTNPERSEATSRNKTKGAEEIHVVVHQRMDPPN
jgi:hypothetical protein